MVFQDYAAAVFAGCRNSLRVHGGQLARDGNIRRTGNRSCLLYTSDAADERSSVDLGGRRIIKKKKKTIHRRREDNTGTKEQKHSWELTNTEV